MTSIHDERGYRRVRDSLARSYDLAIIEPDIQVVDVDLRGDRHLRLQHTMHNAIPLAERSRDEVLKHIRHLWGYDVSLVGIDRETDRKHYEVSTETLGEKT